MADERRHVHEGVVRVAIRDPVVLHALRPHAQPPDREYPAFERSCVQRIEQLVEVEPAVQIRRVLDDQVRQDDDSECDRRGSDNGANMVILERGAVNRIAASAPATPAPDQQQTEDPG